MEWNDIQDIIEDNEQEISIQKTSKNKGAEINSNLKEKQRSLSISLENCRKDNGKNILWLIIWTVVLVVSIYFKSNIYTEMTIIQKVIYYVILIFACFGLLWKLGDFNSNRKRETNFKYDLNVIEDAIFLEEIKGLSLEEKAHKQLSKNQFDNERYVSINLAHTKIIFAIGVIIIFIGILVIVGTIIAIFISQQSVQLIAIVSGFIGGLLVDSVGAVFIMMYNKTIESAQEYQNNLVKASNIYLGNVLASQIIDEELREQTLSIMAKELVKKDERAEE